MCTETSGFESAAERVCLRTAVGRAVALLFFLCCHDRFRLGAKIVLSARRASEAMATKEEEFDSGGVG